MGFARQSGMSDYSVIPAKAGIHPFHAVTIFGWIPAFAELPCAPSVDRSSCE